MRVEKAAALAQLRAMRRMPLTTAFVVLLPVNLLLLLSLFALTGYAAPTAVVLGEDTPTARAFVQALDDTHHSFDLRPMTQAQAREQLLAARLVAIIEIPPGFEQGVRAGRTTAISLTLDNVNLDLTEDVRRAVPAAAALFADREGFPEVRVRPALQNVLRHDTGYVTYLGASAIALAACISGAVLGGTVTAREWEGGTVQLLQLSPGGAAGVLRGRLLCAAGVGVLASLVPAVLLRAAYGIRFVNSFMVLVTVLLTVAVSTVLGGLVGARLRRTVLVAPLAVGTLLPFYLDSGALEPQRFDGPWLFAAAHLSPTYFSVGLAERAVNGLTVTPEPQWVLALVLVVVTALGLVLLPRAAR